MALARSAIRNQTSFLPAMLAVVAGSILIGRHAYLQDCALLFPGLLALQAGGQTRTAGLLLWPPLFVLGWLLPNLLVLPALLVAVLVLLGTNAGVLSKAGVSGLEKLR